MEIYDIVKKLIGNIDPIGESNYNEKALQSLKDTIGLVDKLLSDIADVSHGENSHMHSFFLAGKVARSYLNDVKDV